MVHLERIFLSRQLPVRLLVAGRDHIRAVYLLDDVAELLALLPSVEAALFVFLLPRRDLVVLLIFSVKFQNDFVKLCRWRFLG